MQTKPRPMAWAYDVSAFQACIENGKISVEQY